MPHIDTSDLIREIKEYQSRNSELLKKSHHFVFDCPLDFQNSDETNYIWMGLNPGNDEDDWLKTEGRNDEETRDRDFQEVFGRSRGSKTRKTKIKNFLSSSIFKKTTLTELFFWCSKNITHDFQKRYGTSFSTSPHLEFCIYLNKELINRVQPKAVFFESLDNIKILGDMFNLRKLKIHHAGSRRIDEYLIDEKYRLLNFDHLSAGPPASLERKKVSECLRQIIETK